MIILGLTGSIGMGKSTTARMFAEEGVPVHDSDAAVHKLYEGEAAAGIDRLYPGTVVEGVVDRTKLGARVIGNAEALKKLEEYIHPRVRADADAFVKRHEEAGTALVVLDIPLLFETGGTDRVDRIAVVSAPAEVQRQRVLSRDGMTEEKFAAILSKQVPDEEKRRRADYVIDSSRGLDHARKQVREIVQELSQI
ncbi:dephospho-CoA kinase [Nitratireductor basaltis]|uniref:Dephospho-CoA kinase n=1 Tax=Nitratireductor basaltis TaxID=472175 RepID=A0A084U6C3_9HYPH|nr:dephospho-CoA kinase [Nitratireductor basaltis]KFB08509.1 Dephospho-CoA kinase [Nitratireductor basaltis]